MAKHIVMITDIYNWLINVVTVDGSLLSVAPMWIGAGMSAASSLGNAIFGGLSAHRQKKRQMRAINDAKRRNNNWYDRRYNEGLTDRADVQAMVSRVNNNIKERNRAASGRKAVIGGTDASMASTQAANAREMGNALSAAAVAHDNRKDNIEQSYRQRDDALTDHAANVTAQAEASKRNAVSQAASGAVQAGAAMIASSAADNPRSKGDVTRGPVGIDDKIDNHAIMRTMTPDYRSQVKEYNNLDDYWQRG